MLKWLSLNTRHTILKQEQYTLVTSNLVMIIVRISGVTGPSFAKRAAINTMEKKQKAPPRKCFSCRQPIKSKTDLYCKECKNKPVKNTSGTLVIYDKI